MMQNEGIVQDLVLTSELVAEPIAVGSPAWFAWLAHAKRFRIVTPQGTITVSRERAGGGRGIGYWRAYRKVRGRLHRVYLGPDSALTPDALLAASQTLGSPNAPVPNETPLMPSIAQPNSAPPTVRPGTIHRSPLIARLRAAATHPFVLLQAPAGFGKTTLLAQAFATAELPVAWLTLVPALATPDDVALAVCAAIARIAPTSASLPEAGPALHRLNQLFGLATHWYGVLYLVLDDYQVLTNSAAHSLIAHLLETAPASVHIIIASRTVPPLPLARWRARGLLAELQADELRLNSADVISLVQHTSKLTLTEADASALVERTEGWAAGVQLAALALRDASDPAEAIAAFHGEHRLVADYLRNEVLAGLPDHVRLFLQQTSIVERLSAPLCAAVQGHASKGAVAEAQEMIQQFEQCGLFISPLDTTRTWYRYHRLFAEVLRAELDQTAPDTIAALHMRAAEWHLAQQPAQGSNALKAAIEHTLAAGATARAAELIEQAGLQAAFRGETIALQQWLAALPPSEVRVRPFLHLLAEGHFPGIRHPQSVAMELLTAKHTKPRSTMQYSPQQACEEAELLALRAHVAQACGDLALAATLLLDALALLPASEQALRWHLLVALGNAYALEGWLPAAHMVLTASVELVDSDAVLSYLSRSYRAWSELSMGHIRQAQHAFERLCATAEAAGWAELPLMGDALVGVGVALAEQGELSHGLAKLEQGLALMRRMGFNAILIPGEVERARIYRVLGRPADAHRAIETASELTRDFAAPLLRGRIAAARIDLGLDTLGEPPQPSAAMAYGDVPIVLAWARTAIGDGRIRAACAVLAPLMRLAERRQWGWALLPARLLWARACAAEHKLEQMQQTLSAAVLQAEPAGALLAFLEEGPELLRLLRRVAAMDTNDSAARSAFERVIHALGNVYQQEKLPAHDSIGGIETLSHREREVLGLLANGASNAEIAERLVVTVGTVKAHLRSLFGKLGVTNRTQAARAYHLGLHQRER